MHVALAVMARQNWADALVSLGVRAVCLPYGQMIRRKQDDVRALLETYKQAGAWILIDSGAHQNSGETQEELEEYLEKYIRFVQKNKDLLDCWCEYDPVSYVSVDVVAAWRNRWKDEGLTDRLVVMYHGEEDVLDGSYKHIGLSSGEPDAYYSKFFRERLSDLRDNGVRIYGRGVTRAAVLQLPWFAIDSTTWTAWGRWGHIYFWNTAATRLEVFAQPDAPDLDARNDLRIKEFDRRSVWENAEKAGLAEDLRKLDGWAVDRWNALQWIQLQQHMESQVGNAYWLSDSEKKELISRRRDSNRAAVVVGAQSGSFAGELALREQSVPALLVGRYCGSCAVSEKCPLYKPQDGAECSLSQLRPIDSKEDVIAAVQGLLALQYDRVQFAAMVERVNGGYLTKDVSTNMDMFMDMLIKLKELSTSQTEVTLTAKGPGIISRLFGGIIEEARRGVVEQPPMQIQTIDVINVDSDGKT